MPIKHIDKFAREKGRDVVFVTFEPESNPTLYRKVPHHLHSNWEADNNRIQLIEWLKVNNVPYEPAGNFASETGFMSYNGTLYIDVPFDPTDLQYELVRNRLEKDDGTPRNHFVKFWVLTLDRAMENAHHDEPGFWDKWAETF